MNAKGDANRSVRMTKQRLYQALITLLQQKSLREITVRELTELAGISRGTFYFHYTDIYALMEQMEAAQLKRLNELMDDERHRIKNQHTEGSHIASGKQLDHSPRTEHGACPKHGQHIKKGYAKGNQPRVIHIEHHKPNQQNHIDDAHNFKLRFKISSQNY